MATNRATTGSTANPVLVWMSILSGLQIFLGGAGTVSIVAESYLLAQFVTLAMIAVGAAQAGIQFYVRGQVTPVEDVVERVTSDGLVVAGPANTIVREGTVVRSVNERPAAEQELDATLAQLEQATRTIRENTKTVEQATQVLEGGGPAPFTMDPPDGDHGAV